MRELNNGSCDTHCCADRGGRAVLVGIAIMDPVLMIAALVILAVEVYIRLL